MRKKGYYKPRAYQGDIVHNRVDITRFVSYLMQEGKRSTAERVVYGAFKVLEKLSKEQKPLEVFEKALENATPLLEVVSKRVGGANYQVPREVRPARKFFLASHWIITAARAKKESRWQKNLLKNYWRPQKMKGRQLRKNRIRIAWRKQTEHLHH